MENNQNERAVVTNGTPDLSQMPQDILDMIVAALEINLVKAVAENSDKG